MKYFVLFALLFSVCPVEAQSKKLTELRDLSNFASNNNDRNEVIKKTTEYIKKDSSISEVYEIRARAYEWIDKEQSVRDFKKAIELDSSNVNAHNGLGIMLADLKRYDEALIHYNLALAHGGYIGILINVANVYEEVKDYEGWERTALRMIEPEMDGFDRQLGYFSLARMFESLGDKNKTIVYYIKAIEIGDPDGSDLRKAALLLIELDRKEEACNYLIRAKSAHDYEFGCCDDIPDLIKSNCPK